jgi:hypothetical protein
LQPAALKPAVQSAHRRRRRRKRRRRRRRRGKAAELNVR